jgi:serine/threonine protein kinase
MSTHQNVLRFVGCCLETQVPILVYESIEKETLYCRILGSTFNRPPRKRMAWQSKLKVAREISHAIAYLHNAFSRPIIHRCINLENILFIEHDVLKLSGFSLSITIPDGETHVEDPTLRGSYGFMCPNYRAITRITDKSDIYSFGVLLLLLLLTELLTDDDLLGIEDCDIVKYVRKHNINDIVDPVVMVGEGAAIQDLALACTRDDSEDRPTMINVTKELRWIVRLVQP